MSELTEIKALTFDLFGTVLDLGESLRQPIADFLQSSNANVTAERFWSDWRTQQRLEQYRDTMMALGHSGYLETVRRAMRYVAACHDVHASEPAYRRLMAAWQNLSAFAEVHDALTRLAPRYRLVVLSNGDPEFLDHLVKQRVHFDFDHVFSVTSAGAFKPHPAVYRAAAAQLGIELHECLMVSANSFDVIGARACGMRAAYVDRYRLPLEVSPFTHDIHVRDFAELAAALLGEEHA